MNRSAAELRSGLIQMTCVGSHQIATAPMTRVTISGSGAGESAFERTRRFIKQDPRRDLEPFYRGNVDAARRADSSGNAIRGNRRLRHAYLEREGPVPRADGLSVVRLLQVGARSTCKAAMKDL